MARKTVEKVYSDISGEEIVENSGSLRFAFDGTSYETDLTDDEREKFNAAVAVYIDAARRLSGRSAGKKSASKHDPKAVREWAVANGIDVPVRGRIPASILAAYESASSRS